MVVDIYNVTLWNHLSFSLNSHRIQLTDLIHTVEMQSFQLIAKYILTIAFE